MMVMPRPLSVAVVSWLPAPGVPGSLVDTAQALRSQDAVGAGQRPRPTVEAPPGKQLWGLGLGCRRFRTCGHTGRSQVSARLCRENLYHFCQIHHNSLVSPYIFLNVTEYSAVIN